MNKLSILAIGPIFSNDGWSKAFKEFSKALIATGHNVKLKNIFTCNRYEDCTDMDILSHTTGEYDSYDYVIQNCMPHLFSYDGRFGKNVAWLPFETFFWQNVWPSQIKLMDSVWTPCRYSDQCLKESSSPKHTAIIPVPTNVEKFDGKYDGIIPPDYIDDKFLFYFIGEDIHRKNLDLLIRAFHCEFHRSEPVELVIKTSRPGLNEDSAYSYLLEKCDKIKTKLSLYPDSSYYKKELIITERLSEEEIYALHQQCHAFVMPSAGEGFNLPAADAAGFGNKVIMTDTGCSQFAHHLVRAYRTRVYTDDKPMHDLFTSNEEWLDINQKDLQLAMRWAFKTRDKIDLSKKSQVIEELSYKKIGEEICRALSQIS